MFNMFNEVHFRIFRKEIFETLLLLQLRLIFPVTVQIKNTSHNFEISNKTSQIEIYRRGQWENEKFQMANG